MEISSREQAAGGMIIEFALSNEELIELRDAPDDAVEMATLAGRPEYCISCAAGRGTPNEYKFTMRALNATIAAIQGAPKCLANTGDPSNSVQRGRC